MPVTRRNAALALGCVFSAVTLFGCGPRDVPATGLQTPPPVTMEVKSQPTTIDGGKVNYMPRAFDAFYDEWKENPATAASKYSGRPNGVQFTGKMVKITINQTNQTMVIVTASDATDYTRYVVVGVLTELAGEGLKKCKVGDTVEVKAVGAGITPDDPTVIAYIVTPAR